MDHDTDRRTLLLGSLFAAAASSLTNAPAAAGVDPTKTIILPKNEIVWKPHYGYPPEAVQEVALFGAIGQPGQYLVLIRWQPGFMSAPHFYETDRLCMVLSGTWYVASGDTFDPDATVPVPAGSFVRRVARTTHYDGVKKGAAEPAVIAITGQGPIKAHRVDESQPGYRQL
jgi:hypothetical protein